MKKFLTCLSLILLVGCSVEKPADTSNPKASAKWVSYCRKQAASYSDTELRTHWLIEAYNHAELAGILSDKEAGIPNQVAALAKGDKNEKAFIWAYDKGATPPTHYNELMDFAKLRGAWKEKVLAGNPEAFPVLMSLAIDHYDIQFFNAHAADLIKRGFKVKSPMETTEFKIRYRKFVGERLAEATVKKDTERIRFLVEVMPKIENFNYLGANTAKDIRMAGDYVFHELKNEDLAIAMLEKRFALNPVDFENLPFGEQFLKAFRQDPEYVIRTQALDQWDGRMSEAEARFLTTMPEETWAMLPKLHMDELMELSMKMKDSDAAVRLIQFKAKKSPLTQPDYNELISWALKHSNNMVFDFVMAESGELDIYNIDFASLARNQELFMLHAPKIMNRVYYSMDTDPRADGTTIGRIKQVFGCGNENAGLYLVHKYNLSEAWVKATKGQTLLMDVCEMGNLKAARYLIQNRGEDLHAETGYGELQISLFGSTRPTEGKLSPIFFAAKSGNPELIKYLVSKGANVNARSNFHTTPLMHAVTEGHIGAVKMLIALRADVNAQMNPNLNSMDLRKIGSYHDISNPYRRARSTNNQQMLDLLIKAGANP